MQITSAKELEGHTITTTDGYRYYIDKVVSGMSSARFVVFYGARVTKTGRIAAYPRDQRLHYLGSVAAKAITEKTEGMPV
jgi:hypothetical protein